MATRIDSLLTTVDNPYDPFTHFEEWFAFDTRHQYNTLGLLARITNFSYELSETDQALAIERAIDEIVKENVSGMFRKVSKEIEVPAEDLAED